MSHFTVMVIGDNPEYLLEPYNENRDVEEYEVGEVSEDQMKRFESFYKEKYDDATNLSFDELYEKYGEDWNGGIWRKEDDVWFEYSTYNPNSKWDWYQLGGRWSGYFKLKKGADGEAGSHYAKPPVEEGYADSVKKGDIDIEGMRKEREDQAAKVYDFVWSHFDGNEKNHNAWEHYVKQVENKTITIEEAKELYHEQPSVKKFQEISSSEEGRELLGFFSKFEDFSIPREKYLKAARDSAIAPFAILTDDGWFERGEMGWWACVSNEKDKDEWNEEFTKLFDALPDDTLINLVDCHI